MGELVKFSPRLQKPRIDPDRPRRVSGDAPVGIHNPVLLQRVDWLIDQLNCATGEPPTETEREATRNLVAPLIAISPPENGFRPLLESSLNCRDVPWDAVIDACEERRPGSYRRMRRWIKERCEALGYPNDPNLESVVFFVALWLIPPEMLRPMGTTDLLPPQTVCRLAARS